MYAVKVLPRRGGPVGWLANAQGDIRLFGRYWAASLAGHNGEVFDANVFVVEADEATFRGGVALEVVDYNPGPAERYNAIFNRLQSKLVSLTPVPDFPDDEAQGGEGIL